MLLEQILIALPLVIGAYLTISLLKLPDFSLESAYLMGAIGAFLAEELRFPFIVLSALCAGAIVGLFVTMLNQFFKIPYLLSGIITNGIFHGITQILLKGSLKSFTLPLPMPELPLLIFLTTLLSVFIRLVLRSEFGYSLKIFSNNPLFFQHHNISTKYILFTGIATGHALGGLSGFLFAHSNGFIDLTMNFGIILMCLTSLMLGKCLISEKRPNALIPLVGVASFFVIQQVLIQIGLNLKYFNAFQALFILVILYNGQKKQGTTLNYLGI